MSLEYFTCRKILQIIVIIGFMLDSSLVTNLNSSILVMIKTNTTINKSYGPQYNWTVFQRNSIVGSFFIGVLCSQAISGRISELYGPKNVRFLSIFIANLLTLLQPLACEIGFKMAYEVRLLIGISLAPSIPTATLLFTHWFTPSERTRSIAGITAFNLGVAVSMQTFSLLLWYFEWPVIFYANGVVGIIFSFLWYYFIYNSPEEHPRISQQEKRFIKIKMAKEEYVVCKLKQKLPIRHIIVCVPYLVLVICRTCTGCVQSFIKFQLPIYLNDVLHFRAEHNGFYSSLPFIGHVFFAFLSCYIADKLLEYKRCSRTTVRKLMECFYLFAVTIIMVFLSWWGLNATLAIFFFIICVLFMGAFIAGSFANIIDLAPKFSGTLVGFSSMFYQIGAWFSTLITGLLLQNKNNFEGWQHIFWFMAGFCSITGICYGVFGNAEVQPWNNLEKPKDEKRDLNSLTSNET